MMPEYDHSSEIKIVHSVPPAVHTASATVGAIIDTQGYESCTFVVHIGVAINGSFTVLLEEDEAAGFGSSSVLGSAERIGALPTLAAADENKVFRVGTVGKKRYQRLTLTEGSANSAGVVGVTCILAHAKEIPTSAQST
jgi:hypothetical protein